MENSLHLDLDSLKLDSSGETAEAPPAPVPSSSDEPTTSTAAVPSPSAERDPAALEHSASDARDRKKPYVNPERVKTGGSQRDKLTEEELAERMERIRQQNEKIKQRRVDVQADEDAFRKTQEVERAKVARNRKVQESVDTAREQNAKRKMEKIQSREWDSGKPSPSEWKARHVPTSPGKETAQDSESGSSASQWARGGGGRGSNRGRGRGRGAGAGRRRESSGPTSPSGDPGEVVETSTQAESTSERKPTSTPEIAAAS